MKAGAERLRTLLAGSDDERAVAALRALSQRKSWDLDTLEELSSGTRLAGTDTPALEALAALPVPSLNAAKAGAAELVDVLDAVGVGVVNGSPAGLPISSLVLLFLRC